MRRLETLIFFLLILLLPTQFGKHFWPDFSLVQGLRVDYLSPTIYVTDILIFVLFLICLISKTTSLRHHEMAKQSPTRFVSWSRLPRRSFFAPRNDTLWYIFLCFLLLNIFLSSNIFNGLYHLVKLLEFSFVSYYVATTIEHKQRKIMVILLSVSAIGESLLALWQFVNQGFIGGLFYFFGERAFTSQTPGIANAAINGELVLRPYGTFPHPNVLAGFFLCVMILVLFSFRKQQTLLNKGLAICCLLFGTGGLLLTMSRLAIALWLVIIVVSMIVKQKKALLIMFLVTISLVALVSPFGSRLMHTNVAEESVVQRKELIGASLQLFQKNPILGVGFGNFLPSLATIQKPLSLGLYLQPVHNIFLVVLSETGIIGLSFFLWFLGKTYRHLLQSNNAGLIVLLSVVLLLGLFDHYFLTLQQGQLLLAVIIGLCWTRLGSTSVKKFPNSLR